MVVLPSLNDGNGECQERRELLKGNAERHHGANKCSETQIDFGGFAIDHTGGVDDVTWRPTDGRVRNLKV